MKPISTVVTSFIEKAMVEKKLDLYVTAEGKYLALNDRFETRLKFDLTFLDSAFSCQVLAQGDSGLEMLHSFNIPWTNGAAIRDFMEKIRAIEA